MSDLVKSLRWGWPEDEILSKDMPRVRADALAAAGRIEALEAALKLIADRSEPDVPGLMSDRRVLKWVHGKALAALAPIPLPDAPKQA